MLRRAAVEVGDLGALGRRCAALLALVLAEKPAAELVEVERREGRAVVDAERLFHQHPHRLEPHHHVGQRAPPCRPPAPAPRCSRTPVAPPLRVERILPKLSLAQLGFGRRVDLHHLDAVRAHQRAHAAARAVVQRVVGRRQAGIAEALRLRPDVFRAGEQVRDRHHRACAGADVALDAQIGRALDVFKEQGRVRSCAHKHSRRRAGRLSVIAGLGDLHELRARPGAPRCCARRHSSARSAARRRVDTADRPPSRDRARRPRRPRRRRATTMDRRRRSPACGRAAPWSRPATPCRG